MIAEVNGTSGKISTQGQWTEADAQEKESFRPKGQIEKQEEEEEGGGSRRGGEGEAEEGEVDEEQQQDNRKQSNNKQEKTEEEEKEKRRRKRKRKRRKRSTSRGVVELRQIEAAGSLAHVRSLPRSPTQTCTIYTDTFACCHRTKQIVAPSQHHSIEVVTSILQ